MNISNDLIAFDSEFRKHHKIICGVDEAGRGCLAGEVFAGAVIFDETAYIDGLNDSKKLSAKKRDILYDEVISKCVCYCVATASVDEIEQLNIVKGDGKSFSIAGASILEKVSRDRYMLDMANKYPNYAFDKHKGYGTKLHYQKLEEFGECEIHRPSFLKKFYDKLR